VRTVPRSNRDKQRGITEITPVDPVGHAWDSREERGAVWRCGVWKPSVRMWGTPGISSSGVEVWWCGGVEVWWCGGADADEFLLSDNLYWDESVDA
jgi:hypothetical protein